MRSFVYGDRRDTTSPPPNYDALVVKRSRVVPFIVETFGGVTPHALAHVAYLSRRARGKGARDGTKYGESRTSARGFFNHHVERVGLAAQQYDAKAIRKTVRSLKQGSRRSIK